MSHNSVVNSIESVRGPYDVELSLNRTSAVIDGTMTATSSNGVALFSGLKILTWDYFTLTAAATDMVSGVSSGFYVVNFVKSISIVANETTSSVNFNILLTVTTTGNDDLVFPGDCSISLSESTSSLHGTVLEKTISGGSGTFEVYLSSTGSKTIIATCPNTGTASSVTAEAIVTVQANTLKMTPTTPTVI